MTEVDFYILDGGMREPFICRLVEKIWSQGHDIYIHTLGPIETNRIDELLWTFSEQSFIPHSVVTGSATAPAPGVRQIYIGHTDPPSGVRGVMINLSPQVPHCFSRFSRVVEVIPANEEQKIVGRERFRFYQQRGYPLRSHPIQMTNR